MADSTDRRFNRHIINYALMLGAIGLVAWLSGHWMIILLGALSVLLGWNLWNLYRLAVWMASPRSKAPKSIGIWADIYHRLDKLHQQNKRQKRELKATIREFKRATSAFPVAAVLLDKKNTIVWFNDAAGSNLGLREASDEGQPISNLIRDPGFSRWLEVIGDVEMPFEFPAPSKPEKTLSASCTGYRKNQRLLIFRDITELKRAEQIRRDFVANVSHELRTPLTVLMGYLETIAMDCPERIKSAIDKMAEQGQQMRQLIDDLLELSRLQDIESGDEDEIIDIPALLMQLKEQAETLNRGAREIHFEILSDANLKGSVSDIKSAFSNLISNGMRYTADDGTLWIRWAEDQDSLYFEVQDTGVGIPAEHIPRLTERFYRVKGDRARSTGGTGLGLAIVKHVLNGHQGKLEVESAVGVGSTFRCRFPKSRGAQPIADMREAI